MSEEPKRAPIRYELIGDTGVIFGKQVDENGVEQIVKEIHPVRFVPTAQFVEPMRATHEKSFAEIRKELQEKALNAWVEHEKELASKVHEKSPKEEIERGAQEVSPPQSVSDPELR